MGSIVYKNIFDAVTDSPEASSELQTRSDLMIVIRDIINEQSWTQAEAAKELGLTQPRISDLKKGKLEFRIGFRFKPEYKNHTLKMTVQAVN